MSQPSVRDAITTKEAQICYARRVSEMLHPSVCQSSTIKISDSQVPEAVEFTDAFQTLIGHVRFESHPLQIPELCLVIQERTNATI